MTAKIGKIQNLRFYYFSDSGSDHERLLRRTAYTAEVGATDLLADSDMIDASASIIMLWIAPHNYQG